MDLGAELGAKTYVFWGGREGAEVDAGKCAVTALKRYRDAIDFLCEYNIAQGYGYRFAMEAKPNEPRGDIYLPTNGSMLGFISTLAHPEMVGVNPEVAHETIAGLNFYHAVAQALEMGKLFHVDLNSQKGRPLRSGFALRSGRFERRIFSGAPARIARATTVRATSTRTRCGPQTAKMFCISPRAA
jgi:xylose isomerase